MVMRRCLSIMAFVFVLLASNRVNAEGFVSGFVFEQDSIAPIENAEIAFSGISEEGDTLYYQFFSDTIGYYEAQVEPGVYHIMAWSEG